jgi:hypothetical protein
LVPKSTKETSNPPSPGYGATSIQHPTSNIQHPTSNIQHPTSNVEGEEGKRQINYKAKGLTTKETKGTKKNALRLAAA